MQDLLTQFIRNSPVIAFIKDLEVHNLHVSEAWLSAFHTGRLAKPFSVQELDAAVRALLSRRPG